VLDTALAALCALLDAELTCVVNVPMALVRLVIWLEMLDTALWSEVIEDAAPVADVCSEVNDDDNPLTVEASEVSAVCSVVRAALLAVLLVFTDWSVAFREVRAV
jgi:hypothetical protein